MPSYPYIYRPLARPWECSQSGGQNNCFVLQIGCIPMVFKGSIGAHWAANVYIGTDAYTHGIHHIIKDLVN